MSRATTLTGGTATDGRTVDIREEFSTVPRDVGTTEGKELTLLGPEAEQWGDLRGDLLVNIPPWELARYRRTAAWRREMAPATPCWSGTRQSVLLLQLEGRQRSFLQEIAAVS